MPTEVDMQVTFTWKIIPPLVCIPRKDGRDNVVYKVNWVVTAHTDHDPPLVTVHNDTFEFDSVGPTFTAFEDLTEEQVIGWVKAQFPNGLIVTLENALKERLYIQSLPETVDNPLPWEK